MKSWGSWSSGFPVNEQLVMSAMSESSRRLGVKEYSGSGEDCWVSNGVQEAGVNANWEDWADESVSSDENSSESRPGEVLRVVGMKRCSSSLSLVAMG